MSGAFSIRVLLIAAGSLLIFMSMEGQDADIDTSEYIPWQFEGALDYNLMIAASKGYASECERLIKNSADVKSKTAEGATPLVIAVANRKPGAVRVLLSYGADPDVLTSSYETPILITLRDLVSLESKGINIITPGLEAECLDIAETLIRYGADIDKQDRFGVTALNYAAVYGSFRFADLLIYYMADIDKKANDGTTPLMAAIWAGNASIADLLVLNGANLEARDNNGFTPFLIAAQNGDTLLMNYLISKGIDIYERDKFNWDALGIVIKYNHIEAARLLLKRGNKWIETGNKDLNYQSIAAKFGRREIIELLDKYGFPSKHKFRISQTDISLSSKLNLQDTYTGIKFSFREPTYKAGLTIGYDTKLWNTRVLVKENEGTYYQYLNKGSIAYAGLFKEINLTDNQFKANFLLSASLYGAWFFGNQFTGTTYKTPDKLKIIPSIDLILKRKNYAIFLGLEYMKPEFEKIWPVWARAGLKYTFDFDFVKTPVKDIRWY